MTFYLLTETGGLLLLEAGAGALLLETDELPVRDVRGGFPGISRHSRDAHAEKASAEAAAAMARRRRLRLEQDDREILEIIQIFMIHNRLP